MAGELRQMDSQQLSEHGHVHGEGPQIVGEVALRQHVVHQVDHHLEKQTHGNLR